MKFVFSHLNRAVNLSRKSKILIQVLTDVLVFFGCFLLVILLQGKSLQLMASPVILLSIIISIVSGIATFALLGLYQSLVRYITPHVLMIKPKVCWFHPLAWLYFCYYWRRYSINSFIKLRITIIFNDGSNPFSAQATFTQFLKTESRR